MRVWYSGFLYRFGYRSGITRTYAGIPIPDLHNQPRHAKDTINTTPELKVFTFSESENMKGRIRRRYDHYLSFVTWKRYKTDYLFAYLHTLNTLVLFNTLR